MNIHDVKAELPEGDRLQNIFNRQHELRLKYHDIEKKNGFYSPDFLPVSIHNAKDQGAIKDIFWRFVEEIGESLDAFESGHWSHCHEEISDALHFLVEACLIIGIFARDLAGDTKNVDGLEFLYAINPISTDLIKEQPYVAHRLYMLIKDVAMSANCLKNKPWKQTHMMTDEMVFRLRVISTFNRFIQFAKACGITNPQDLYDLYFRKSNVNKFRQESQY